MGGADNEACEAARRERCVNLIQQGSAKGYKHDPNNESVVGRLVVAVEHCFGHERPFCCSPQNGFCIGNELSLAKDGAISLGTTIVISV